MIDLLRRCGPMNVEEMSLTIDNCSSTIDELLLDNIIEIKNRFIFLKNEQINFHYVKKDNDERRFDFVSNEEIAMGIRIILTQRSFHYDDMIKLILLSLGLKKMNRDQYLRIQNIIDDLIDDKFIEKKDDYLYKIENSN